MTNNSEPSHGPVGLTFLIYYYYYLLPLLKSDFLCSQTVYCDIAFLPPFNKKNAQSYDIHIKTSGLWSAIILN